MNAPQVSVIVPTHNRRGFLQRALQSIIAQQGVDLEIIVVDDASTDDTPAFLAALAATEPRIRVIRNVTASGGGAARNTGIAVARGQWIAFLDDDDEWLPRKLGRQLELLAANPDAVAASSSFEQHFPSGKKRIFEVPARASLAEILSQNVLGGASVCVCASEILRAIGGFDPRLRSAQDYDLWIRLRQHGIVVGCPESLVIYREHDGSRISTRVSSQYLGMRRFYFKHRRAMDTDSRRGHFAWLCAIKARQPALSARARLRYLSLAGRTARPRAALSYGVRGMASLLRGVA